MALSRRGFVQAVGIGSATALTGAWIGARGREDRIWSAFEPTLEAVEPGKICLSSNENPLGPGKTVMKAVRAAFGDGGRAPGRYSSSGGDLIDAIAKKLGVKPDNIVLGCGSTQILRTVDAPLHREGQGARRHDSHLRRMRRLCGDDGTSRPRRLARRRLQDGSRQVCRRREGRGPRLLLQSQQSDGNLRRRESHARLSGEGQPRVTRDDDPGGRSLFRLRHRPRSRHA